jgi:hypothetical protein
MFHVSSIGAIAVAALCIVGTGTQAQDASKYDPSKYPDWSGPMRWTATGGGNRYDQTKPPGRGQQAPLTPEYQALFEAGLKDQAQGGQGANQTYSCLPGGLPRDMAGNQGLEFVVTPKVTHVIFVHAMPRRIYTDGRDWPENEDPSFYGYSIGKWIDEDGDGRYDVLEVETRGFKGPRAFDETGLPLHVDNQSIFKERIWRDKADPNILHDEITTIDHALTRPWTVDKRYVHNPDPRPDWIEFYTTENNAQIAIGKENYFLSGDGLLMPAKKNQAPPDLRYFKPTAK